MVIASKKEIEAFLYFYPASLIFPSNNPKKNSHTLLFP
jgi:hypothetical protein